MHWRRILSNCRSSNRTRTTTRPRRLAPERLEPRWLLASHPGFVYDADDHLVAVDPAVQATIGDLLSLISADYEHQEGLTATYSPPPDTPRRDSLVWADGDAIAVTAVARAGEVATLREAVEAIGGRPIAIAADTLSTWVPFGALDDLASLPSLHHADAFIEPVANSSITNQAGLALEADVARARFGVDGSGIRIGLISDSFNTLEGYAFDVASGVLPADVVVVKEYPVTVEDGLPIRGTDEGRAMAQLVYSIAPGANLFFATSGRGPADFADSIERLVAAGCEIIVDDITEAGVPWFQDGVVAQAVNAAVLDAGVTYLTSAGNFGRNSYASDFRGVAASDLSGLPAELTDPPGLVLHDFDPGPAVDVFQRLLIPDGTSSIQFTMQWDQPWGANGSDIDLLIYAADRQTLLERLEGSHQTGADPEIGGTVQVLEGITEVQVVVAHAGGVAPGYLKYVTFHANLGMEYSDGSSTIVGHANSATAAAVGASSYFRTPAYRNTPAELAGYSSWGGTPILFTIDGGRLPVPLARQQPSFVAPNQGDTSFFGEDVDLNGLPNFSGTSASAPDAAAVVALMKQLDPTLASTEIFAALAATADDMGDAGGPLATGAGLINAERALALVAGIAVAGTVFEDLDQDGSQSAGELPLADATVYLDLNGNGQFDRAPAADAPFAYLGFQSSGATAIGIRTLIDNPNLSASGPLQWPFTATSEIEVGDLPGVITDLGVVFSLQSDQVLDDELIGPLFITLVSPAGIRVPLSGSMVSGNGTTASPYETAPTILPADGRAYPLLVSQFETPVSEFLNGSGHAVLSQVDLAAIVGSDPNGRWQLEVQSADTDPARTATLDSWELYLQTAEPSTTTDADGGYAFSGLSPAGVAGPIRPRLLVPAGRSLLAPQSAYGFSLSVGEQAADANFLVTPAAGFEDAVADVAVGQTAYDTTPYAGDVRLVKRGDGRLILDLSNSHSGGTVVESGELVIRTPAALGSGGLQVLAGARVVLDVGTQRVALPSLALSSSATLDLTTGSILLTPGSYDLPAIQALTTAGRDGGSWAGLGITSTSIQPGSFRGVGSRPLPDESLVVGFAAVGDATMDGRVDVLDLIEVSASGVFDRRVAAGWRQGDFTYDGRADQADLFALSISGLYGSGPYLSDVTVAIAAPRESTLAAQQPWVDATFRMRQFAWAVIGNEDKPIQL